jgi:DNA-binding transcriptional LysR family regulator
MPIWYDQFVLVNLLQRIEGESLWFFCPDLANAEFRQRYPGIELELDFNDRVVDLVESGMALCVGGLTLSRAVANRPLSDRILSVCRNAVTTLSEGPDSRTSARGGSV